MQISHDFIATKNCPSNYSSRFMTIGRIGTNTDLTTDNFAVFESSCFNTTKR